MKLTVIQIYGGRKKMPKISKMIKDIGEDTLNRLINTFLNEHSDRMMEDSNLVTKKVLMTSKAI